MSLALGLTWPCHELGLDLALWLVWLLGLDVHKNIKPYSFPCLGMFCLVGNLRATQVPEPETFAALQFKPAC